MELKHLLTSVRGCFCYTKIQGGHENGWRNDHQLYNGYNLDAVRKADEYGLTYEIGEVELHEDFMEAVRFMTAICQEENTVGMVSMGFESQFWQVPTLNGAWKLDGSVLLEILRHPHEYGQHFDFGKIENKEENDYHVRLDKDLWFLDGSQNLNGKRILDAERREEELT